MSQPQLASLAAAIADLTRQPGSPLLVVTGAGISVASGIPTFRGTDPGAVWTRDVTELATRRFFSHDPVASWQWYLGRFSTVAAAKPNRAHQALVDLERWQVARGGEFLLVTQNIDTLHRRAGSERLVEVHGSADLVRCSREGCKLAAPDGHLPLSTVDLPGFAAAPSLATLPRCPLCRAILRPHVLWFDEHYGEHSSYQIERVLDSAETAATVLFVGTSFAVGITAMVVDHGRLHRVPMWSIDPGNASPPHRRIEALRLAAEVALPSLIQALGGVQAKPA